VHRVEVIKAISSRGKPYKTVKSVYHSVKRPLYTIVKCLRRQVHKIAHHHVLNSNLLLHLVGQHIYKMLQNIGLPDTAIYAY